MILLPSDVHQLKMIKYQTSGQFFGQKEEKEAVYLTCYDNQLWSCWYGQISTCWNFCISQKVRSMLQIHHFTLQLILKAINKSDIAWYMLCVSRSTKYIFFCIAFHYLRNFPFTWVKILNAVAIPTAPIPTTVTLWWVFRSESSVTSWNNSSCTLAIFTSISSVWRGRKNFNAISDCNYLLALVSSYAVFYINMRDFYELLLCITSILFFDFAYDFEKPARSIGKCEKVYFYSQIIAQFTNP